MSTASLVLVVYIAYTYRSESEALAPVLPALKSAVRFC